MCIGLYKFSFRHWANIIHHIVQEKEGGGGVMEYKIKPVAKNYSWAVVSLLLHTYVTYESLQSVGHFVPASMCWGMWEAMTNHITSQMYSKVWDEISYPFPNFNGTTIEDREWKSNFIPHFTVHVIIYYD